MLAVSDGVADLLGVGVVEIMGSQLTDMVTHISSMQHPYEKPLPRAILILMWLIPLLIKTSDPRPLPQCETSSQPSYQPGSPVWPQPAPRTFPARPRYSPSRYTRQVAFHLHLYASSLFRCSFWILHVIQNKTSYKIKRSRFWLLSIWDSFLFTILNFLS